MFDFQILGKTRWGGSKSQFPIRKTGGGDPSARRGDVSLHDVKVVGRKEKVKALHSIQVIYEKRLR